MFLAATTVQKTPDNFWSVTLAEYEAQGKDLRHGPSKVWFESGKRQVEGFYQQDKRSGTFTYWYANGQVAATGEFADDKPNDVWVWWHENGQKAAVGKYDARQAGRRLAVVERRRQAGPGEDLQRHRSDRFDATGSARTRPCSEPRKASPRVRQVLNSRGSSAVETVEYENHRPRQIDCDRRGFSFALAEYIVDPCVAPNFEVQGASAIIAPGKIPNGGHGDNP